MAQWVAAQFGISQWAARRWIAAGHALRELPKTRRALSSGRLSLDKLLELTRFATPDSEAKLITWALGVSAQAIRRKPTSQGATTSRKSEPTTVPAR